ncbi:helix-turn-helix domain-containing protein [Hamadaea tsunoensis]|uniref:helix-turn-helix domain-containing protein n=1 Tax=Hamadaea tsunoensis TaxID=53368 RepID=UPI00040207EE|nr:helix-turn-helix domain-containing protein [Hamadaea tsunoensis]
MEASGSFAGMLRSQRHRVGLTLEELAEASGVSTRALSDMERGRALGPQRRTVLLIADALKLEAAGRAEFVALAKAGRARSAYLAAAPGLCELPGSIGDFTGRAAELAWLYRLAEEPVDGPHVAIVSGGAGLGKTTLVVRAAHGLRDRFPGGVLFVDALGMSRRPVASDELLSRLLRALGVRTQHIPDDAAEKAGRYRRLLSERQVLVIVDDAQSEAQVRPLLPGDGRSLLLVGSRRLLSGLEAARRLHLDPMPVPDAQDLLGRIVAERFDPRDEDLTGLVELLGGLPLALRIVGNRLISRPGWSAADLVDRLSAAERRLEQLSAGDLKVAAAFGMSYEQLPAATRQMFRRVSLVAGPDFGTALAAVVGDVGVHDAEDQLDDLVDLSLMGTAEGGRYRFHDLVRLYAHQRLEVDEPSGTVTAVRDRMVAWLLETMTAAGLWFEPDGAQSRFASAEEADQWLRVESEHWLPALGAAALAGRHDAVVRATSALHWYSDRWVDWPRWAEVFMLGHDSAERLGDPGRQAEFLNYVAWTHTLPWRDKRNVLPYAERALALARAAGDLLQEAWALAYTARALGPLGEAAAAMTAVLQAADLFEQAGDVDASCQAWIERGDLQLRLGDPDAALASFRRAQQTVDDPASGMTTTIADYTRPHVLIYLGKALGVSGQAEAGRAMMQQALDILEREQQPLEYAVALQALAALYDDGAVEARDNLLRAAELYDNAGLPDAAARMRAAAAEHGPAPR